MFTKYSNGLKGITLALAIAATSLSSAQAFGSSIESPEYGNSAWNWWDNEASVQTAAATKNSQLVTLIKHPETRSSEFGHVAWNKWGATDMAVNNTSHSGSTYTEVSPEYGHVPAPGWEKANPDSSR